MQVLRGAPGKIRTFDNRFRRPVLYPAELRALNRTRLLAKLIRFGQRQSYQHAWNVDRSAWGHEGEPSRETPEVAKHDTSARG